MAVEIRRVGYLALLSFIALSVPQAPAKQGQGTVDGFIVSGSALFDKGDLKGAKAAFEEALTLNPKQANAHNLLGTTYEKLGLPFEAIRQFKAARHFDPSSPEFLYNLALAYFHSGFYDRTVATLQ